MPRYTSLAAAAASITVMALLVLSTGSARAATSARCPSEGTPAAGTMINGGLEVDGFCVLTHVTINGQLTIDSTPIAQLLCCNQNLALLNGSTVNGGVYVDRASGVGTGIDPATFTLTHDRSTINGPVALNASGFLFADATIGGGLIKNGAFDWPSICGGDPSCFGTDQLCGSSVSGAITIRDTNTEEVFIGDPKEQLFPNGDCAGNTINGSVFLQDTNFVASGGEPAEIEGNTITGSVRLEHSTTEVNENTIGGSLLCTTGTVIRPPVAPDLPGNNISGKNSCG